MIHATFADGETALFEPSELVDTCEWISDDGEYFDNPVTNYAYLAIKPGVYLLERTSDGYAVCCNTTKIVAVREV